MNDETRNSPHNIEAEEGFLSACMIDSDAFEHSRSINMTPEWFHVERHKIIYGKMCQIFDDGIPIDEVILFDYLQKSGQSDEVGGLSAIYRIQGRVESSIGAKYHAKIIHEKHLTRLSIRAARQTIESLHSQEDDPISVASKAESTFKEIIDGAHTGSKFKTAEELVDASLLNYAAAEEEGGCPVPILGLRRMLTTGNLQPGDMVVIGARPSVGKSALAGNFAEYAATDNQIGVLIFSLEMTSENWISRISCSRSGVDSKKFSRKQLNSSEQQRLAKAMKEIKRSNIWVDDSFDLTASSLRARAIQQANIAKRQGNPIGLIVLDYLQLLGEEGKSADGNRERELAKQSRACKAIAREVGCPVIVLSQLNRSGEQSGREPRLSDLRESGAIEQDADIVMFLHRGSSIDPVGDEEEIKLIVAKQRNGQIGSVDMIFHKSTTRFRDKH